MGKKLIRFGEEKKETKRQVCETDVNRFELKKKKKKRPDSSRYYLEESLMLSAATLLPSVFLAVIIFLFCFSVLLFTQMDWFFCESLVFSQAALRAQHEGNAVYYSDR